MGKNNKGKAKAVERRQSTPERDLPLVGDPVTPKGALLGPLVISPKLKQSMAPEDISEIQTNVSTTATATATVEELVDKYANQLADAYRKVKKRQVELEATLEVVTANIGRIDQKWADGRIELGQGDYKIEKQKLLQEQLEIMTAVTITRSMGSQLAGRWIDDMATGERVAFDDWAYIDAAIRCYPEVPHGAKSVKSKRSPQKEKAFRKSLIQAYASMNETGTKIWCPIEGNYIFTTMNAVVAAHIVNANVGEATAQALFGSDVQHIWNVKNGLIIFKEYERLLDSAKAVILPVSDSPEETEFCFFLLTKDIGREKAAIWGDELHGRRLQFKNAFRPSKRYLYFKFAISLLRRRRAEVPGHLEDLQNIPDFSKSLWASPGPYLKRSILYKLSRQLGCLTSEEADRFWGIDKTPTEHLSAESDDRAMTMAIAASAAIGTQDAQNAGDSCSEDEGDDSEDEDREGSGEEEDDEEEDDEE